MLRIVLCDDDVVARKILRSSLGKILKGRALSFEILEFSSGEELIKKYPCGVDFLFLDVKLKKYDGIETARTIRNADNDVDIIFVTAFSEYATKGYEVNACRYLMKDISFEEFRHNINICVDTRLNKKYQYLIIISKNDFIRIQFKDIYFIETSGRGIVIHTENGDKKFNMSMKEIENKLNQLKFCRCHTSYIVNLEKLDEIKNDIIIVNDVVIPVSKHRYKMFRAKMTSYLGES